MRMTYLSLVRRKEKDMQGRRRRGSRLTHTQDSRRNAWSLRRQDAVRAPKKVGGVESWLDATRTVPENTNRTANKPPLN